MHTGYHSPAKTAGLTLAIWFNNRCLSCLLSLLFYSQIGTGSLTEKTTHAGWITGGAPSVNYSSVVPGINSFCENNPAIPRHAPTDAYSTDSGMSFGAGRLRKEYTSCIRLYGFSFGCASAKNYMNRMHTCNFCASSSDPATWKRPRGKHGPCPLLFQQALHLIRYQRL